MSAFKLPIIGKFGDRKVVIGRTDVPNDKKILAVLLSYKWNTQPGGYVFSHPKRKLKIYLHRLLYELRHGKIPDGLEIDHIDRNPRNNTFKNLRAVPHSDNMRNSNRRLGVSGHRGVYRDNGKNHWYTRLSLNGKEVYIGSFPTFDQAVRARRRAEKRYWSSTKQLLSASA